MKTDTVSQFNHYSDPEFHQKFRKKFTNFIQKTHLFLRVPSQNYVQILEWLQSEHLALQILIFFTFWGHSGFPGSDPTLVHTVLHPLTLEGKILKGTVAPE